MAYMFAYCQADKLDVSHFDTHNVTSMHNMFRGCQAKELDVSNFDTSKVLDFSYMFSNYNGHIIGKYKFPKEAFIWE